MADWTDEEVADLDNWDRKRLQRLCKKVGIRANLRNVELIELLRVHFKKPAAPESDCADLEEQAPKRRRTLSPQRDPSPDDQETTPNDKAKKRKKHKHEARTSVAIKRLVRRRKSRRPPKTLTEDDNVEDDTADIKRNATEEADEESESQPPLQLFEQKEQAVITHSDLAFDDLGEELEPPKLSKSEDVIATATAARDEDEESDTQDKSEVPEKEEVSAAVPLKQEATIPNEPPVHRNEAVPPTSRETAPQHKTPSARPSTTRKRKSGEMDTERKEDAGGPPVSAKKSKATTTTTTKGAARPTRTVILRQQAKQVLQKALNLNTQKSSTAFRGRIATPMPSMAASRIGTARKALAAPGTKPAGSRPTTPAIKARPAPNFDAIHQKDFDRMKSIFDKEPSSSSGEKPPLPPKKDLAASISTVPTRKRKAAEKPIMEAEKRKTSGKPPLVRTTSDSRPTPGKAAPRSRIPPSVPAASAKVPLGRSTSTRTLGKPGSDDAGRATSRLGNNENERNRANLPTTKTTTNGTAKAAAPATKAVVSGKGVSGKVS